MEWRGSFFHICWWVRFPRWPWVRVWKTPPQDWWRWRLWDFSKYIDDKDRQ